MVTAKHIMDSYAIVSKNLTDAEKPHYDKLILLMKEVDETPSSPRLLALQAAIILGLFTVTGPKYLLDFLTVKLVKLAITLASLSAEVRHGG